MQIESNKIEIHRLQQQLADSMQEPQRQLLIELIQKMLDYEKKLWQNIDTEAEYQTWKWLMRANWVWDAIKAYNNILPKHES